MNADKKIKLLFISYNAVIDSVAQSQVIPYLEEMTLKGVNVSLLTYEKTDVKATSEFKKQIRTRLLKSGIKWYCLKYHKYPTLPATMYDIAQGIVYVYFLLAKHKFNIIHARMIVPAAICVGLRKLKKFKWVFDMRGLVAEEYVGHGSWREGGVKFRLVKFVEQLCLLKTDFITVLTYKQKDFILSLPFLNKKKVHIDVIPCCVDLDKFVLVNNKKIEIFSKLGICGKFVLVYSGSLGTCYLLSEMVDYFLYLRSKIKNAYFLFLTNSNKELIVNKIIKKGLNSDDFSVLSLRFEDMPSVLSACDAGIYFIKAYKKFGSCPIKFGEYLACGLPVIINKGIGDTEEITRQHGVGVVVNDFMEEFYKDSLDDMVGKLMIERENLKKRCRMVAERFFSLKEGSQKYCSIYLSLIK